MLSGCVTRKILHNGDQHGKEKRSIISWYPDRIAEDNEAMLNSPLSLDVAQNFSDQIKKQDYSPQRNSSTT